MDKHCSTYDYDVCLSFAGENRDYVESVAAILRERGFRVFYDKYEEVKLWGKDLYEHLDDVYRKTARYCILFISQAYRDKLWTNHERQSAQARAFRENQDYLLPVRFDDTEIPGLRETIGYIDLRHKTAEELAEMIEIKIGPPIRENYFPPNPVGLFESLDIKNKDLQNAITSCAQWFLNELERMAPEEREVIFRLFMDGCPADLPSNIHISQDLLSRVTGFTIQKLRKILGSLDSLGFQTKEEEDEICEHIGHGKLFVTEWIDRREDGFVYSTLIAHEIITLVSTKCCEYHALEYLRRLDFSLLAIRASD